MREGKRLEFKEQVSGSFLKTVSAFANCDGGEILFGVSDDGRPVGLKDPGEDRLRIENAVNDGISPRPEFELEEDSRTGVVTLRVFEGIDKPYFYRSRAYTRTDSATVEVDRVELKRLVLEGLNKTFDEAESQDQDLTFTGLSEALEHELGLDVFNDDTLKTLGLFSAKEGFNNAAALLSDSNGFPGIDIARFGGDISTILDRETYEGVSVLTQLDGALSMFDRYYVFERIEGFSRERHERIPREAYREAVANALAHRLWDINAHIRVAMFDDRIEVMSPGGLPKGVTAEDYLEGYLSMLRNPVLANVMHRLHIIEQFGTGIRRIKKSYSESAVKPRFAINVGSISVTLPVVDPLPALEPDEEVVFGLLDAGQALSSSQVAAGSGFGRDKTLRLLGQLIAKNLVLKQGSGRGTRYSKG